MSRWLSYLSHRGGLLTAYDGGRGGLGVFIKRLMVEEGFLDGLGLDFVPGLNVLIGAAWHWENVGG